MCDSVSESLCANTKKRKRFGRVSDASKKLRAQSFETGKECNCRNKCFEKLQVSDIQKIIRDFNALADWNAQSSHLAGLITVQLISRRRSRKNEDDAQCHDASFSYRVKQTAEDGRIGDFVVCQKAFLSLHGITKKRLQTIQRSLKFSGLAPTDGRGKHGNRPHKLSTGTHDKVIEHIKSFKDQSKSLLNGENTLNVKRM